MHDEAALYDVDALRRIEAQAARRLGDAAELMRRAGQAAWQALLDPWPGAQRIVVVCGPGNNGGDGYVLAEHARVSGRTATVVRAHAPRGELAVDAARRFVDAGGRVEDFDGARLPVADVVVDALFGIGLARAPDGEAAALVEAINRAGVPVLALDVPSGVDGGRGAVPGVAVRATVTLEFIAPKAGLATGPALDHGGHRRLATLDLGPTDFQGVEPCAHALRADDLACLPLRRRRDSHKGDNGRVLCIGGDAGHGGAILLAAEAALRTGAGLVDVATRERHVGPMLARRPEAMVRGIEPGSTAALTALLEGCDVVACGPGLGQSAWGRDLFDRVLACGRPLVLDADALNLLADRPDARLRRDAVVTPHPGEAARLLGVSTREVQADRLQAARGLAAKLDCTVVLKGAGTVVAAPGRIARVVAAGNPGMAVGGMGDVLCGSVAALGAQGLEAFDAACWGALLHSAAADVAVGRHGTRGLLPSDLMPWLGQLGGEGWEP